MNGQITTIQTLFAHPICLLVHILDELSNLNLVWSFYKFYFFNRYMVVLFIYFPVRIMIKIIHVFEGGGMGGDYDLCSDLCVY